MWHPSNDALLKLRSIAYFVDGTFGVQHGWRFTYHDTIYHIKKQHNCPLQTGLLLFKDDVLLIDIKAANGLISVARNVYINSISSIDDVACSLLATLDIPAEKSSEANWDVFDWLRPSPDISMCLWLERLRSLPKYVYDSAVLG